MTLRSKPTQSDIDRISQDSSPSLSLRQNLKASMQHCRQLTLALFEGMDTDTFCRQIHADFSPVGWHLGHIAFTEAFWLLEQSAGQENPLAQYRRLYAADGLPKSERVHLPSLSATLVTLDRVRHQVWDYLEIAPLQQQERLWHFLLQHESQHCETIALLLELQRIQSASLASPASRHSTPMPLPVSPPRSSAPCQLTNMIPIPAGEFEMGNGGMEALDNERSPHRVYLETYWIDRYPVTCGQFRAFLQAGGYNQPQWWSEAGWQWLQQAQVRQPLYWTDDPTRDNHPVCGVSWYEADAYARFVGKRLPTEAEWEKAARWQPQLQRSQTYPWGETWPDASHCNQAHAIGQTTPVDTYAQGQSAYGCYDLLGNVWEWTNTWFEPYAGFQPYPYRGYSQTYFDGQHRVLKGGSWATRPWALRSAFRNWYYPQTREILAGFRCAISGS